MKTFLSLSRIIKLHATLPHIDLGIAGERLAIALFQENGFIAHKQSAFYHGDVSITSRETGLVSAIEVKIARVSTGKRRRWQFCMNKEDHTSCSFSNYCLLFAVTDCEIAAYLMPSVAVGRRKTIEISSPNSYCGQFQKYRINPLAFSLEAQDCAFEMS